MFKAGDRVKNKIGTTFSNGAFVNTVDRVAEEGMVWLLETKTWVGVESIEHESPTASPVRTVTRREIVPGVYGKVFINHSDNNIVSINVRNDFGCVEFNAEELREAAHLFNQLAEVLEGEK